MNVLITGGAGFVGHHLLEYLLDKTSWNFYVIESFRHGGISKKISYLLEQNKNYNNRVKVFTHDLSTPIDSVFFSDLKDINVIVNVASFCSVDESIANPIYFINNNINLQLNILEYARKLKDLKLFVHISTDEVFGPASDFEVYTENQQLSPSNPYSASKASQESICNAYRSTYGVPIVITNTMNMFGERQSTKAFIPKTIKYLLNKKVVPVYSELINGQYISCSRHYLYIKNHSDAIKFIIDYHINNLDQACDKSINIPRYNILDNNEIDNDKLVEMICSKMNITGKNNFEYVEAEKFRPGHDRRYSLNGDKLTSMGWTPPYKFEEGLSQTINWFLNNKSWLND